MLSVVVLSVVMPDCRYVECCYAECRYAECHYTECRSAINDVMLSQKFVPVRVTRLGDFSPIRLLFVGSLKK